MILRRSSVRTRRSVQERPVLCSLNAVNVVNTVITHRVHYTEERERIVGAFSCVMDVPGCRGYSCAFSAN